MQLPIYQLDVFTRDIFKGNPAAVVIMEDVTDHRLMQNIAAENNLSETAFIMKGPDHYRIRWFTPTVEVDLCGHATMASGHVVLYLLDPESREVVFQSAQYTLTVRKKGDHLAMRLPAAKSEKCAVPSDLLRGLGKEPAEVYKSDDYMAVFESRNDIKAMQPDFEALRKLDCRGVIVTAPGDNADMVSRFFAPSIGVLEDPVTGSAHTKLVPYWSDRLGKKELHAEQLSSRGGKLICQNQGEHVELMGKARIYLEGYIHTQ